jgi:hypothetical protein
MPGIFKGKVVGAGKETYATFCGVCGYLAPNVFKGKRHYLRHTGEKPFKCPFCPFASARNENLTGHIQRVHFAV